VAVTGASRGIGLAVATQLATLGARVLAGARSLAPAPHPLIHLQHLDVTDEASVQAFAHAAAALGVDALVCNAGVGSFAPIEDATVQEYRRIFDTNVLGTLLPCRAFMPLWRQRHAGPAGEAPVRSRVIIVTSDVSTRSFAGGALYAGSKHAQRALAQALAHEGQAWGLGVTEIRPGLTDTHFNGQVAGRPEAASHLRPEDVAAAVAHALSAPAHARIDEIVLHPVSQPVA
jgi:NAD(P)-dependent dehydrogenase (short-subunit alcohol dehydrogenase family)